MGLLILNIFRKYWKYIFIILIVVILGYALYNKIYYIGYEAANIECAAKFKEYSDSLDKRISKLESSSTQLVLESIENRKGLKKDFTSILLTIKDKPLYTIEQGVCKPSPDFVKAYNDAVDRANR